MVTSEKSRSTIGSIVALFERETKLDRELEEEARTLLLEHTKDASTSVDFYRLLQTIKTKLAKEKGVVL